MFIYKATSATTGKVYIGQTTQTLQERINQHNSHAFGHQYNYHFHNAIRKYGADDFSYEIIEDNIKSVETLNERERYWISYYNSYYDGYNSTMGGEGRVCRDDELIVKLFKDGYTTQEICEITGYNRRTVYKGYRAMALTEENNRRKAERTRQRCARAVEQYTIDGELIRVWSSATECGKALGSQSLISAICRQEESMLSAYGCLFKYADDPRDISEWVARLKNKKNSGRPKKEIEQYDSDNNLVCTYESASAAATALGKKDKSNICAAARKGVKAYGYYWKYK
jgi:group I intron endonuclease